MLSPDEFERRVERLYEVLENEECLITWNKKLRDPHTSIERQIDIEIKRPDGKVCHVECRNRKAKQDVMWVEELIGRRQSLGVSEIMGVSASGFTKGAYQKAAACGIQLWQLNHLDPDTFRQLLIPPDIYFLIHKVTELRCLYFVPAENIVEATEEISQLIDQHLDYEIRRTINHLWKFRPSHDVGITSMTRSVHQAAFFGKSCVMRRELTLEFESCFKLGSIQTMEGFRNGQPTDRSFLAKVLLHGFSGIEAECVISPTKWLFTLDLAKVQYPESTIIANLAHIESEELGGKRFKFMFKVPERFEVTLPVFYDVLPDLI